MSSDSKNPAAATFASLLDFTADERATVMRILSESADFRTLLAARAPRRKAASPARIWNAGYIAGGSCKRSKSGPSARASPHSVLESGRENGRRATRRDRVLPGGP
jgi:hypothetical protein